MASTITRVLALAAAAMLHSAAWAQQLLWEQAGVRFQTELGYSNFTFGGGKMANVGDLDSDGCDDLAVLGGDIPAQRSLLFFFSGRDGTTIRALRNPESYDPFTRVAAAGDVDGDTTADYAVLVEHTTSMFPNRVEVRSGKDDTILWEVERPWAEAFGYAILGDVDLDADGRPDLVATGPRSSEGQLGAVFAYDHRGTPLWQVLGTPERPIAWQGDPEVLDRIGDFDGDGCDDVLVGGWDSEHGTGAGIVLSGRDGSELVRGVGLGAGPIGEHVASLGDIDGDGVADFAAGSRLAGIAVAFSGRSGAELYRWQVRGLFCVSMDAGIDLDQDGLGDVLVGHTTSQPSAVFAFSGRDGTQLFRLDSTGPGGWFGYSVVALGTHPDSPFPVFAVDQAEYGPYIWGFQGRVQVFRSAPPSVHVLGQPCAGTLSSAPRIGIRDVGGTRTRLHLSDAEPQSAGAVVLGLSSTAWGPLSLPVPLGPFGFTGCELRVSMDLLLGVATGAGGNQRGYAALDLPLPLAGPGQGVATLYGQWIALGSASTSPGGVTAALSWEH